MANLENAPIIPPATPADKLIQMYIVDADSAGVAQAEWAKYALLNITMRISSALGILYPNPFDLIAAQRWAQRDSNPMTNE